ncbi:Midasin-like 3, partial [Homarus americanus]
MNDDHDHYGVVKEGKDFIIVRRGKKVSEENDSNNDEDSENDTGEEIDSEKEEAKTFVSEKDIEIEKKEKEEEEDNRERENNVKEVENKGREIENKEMELKKREMEIKREEKVPEREKKNKESENKLQEKDIDTKRGEDVQERKMETKERDKKLQEGDKIEPMEVDELRSVQEEEGGNIVGSPEKDDAVEMDDMDEESRSDVIEAQDETKQDDKDEDMECIDKEESDGFRAPEKEKKMDVDVLLRREEKGSEITNTEGKEDVDAETPELKDVDEMGVKRKDEDVTLFKTEEVKKKDVEKEKHMGIDMRENREVVKTKQGVVHKQEQETEVMEYKQENGGGTKIEGIKDTSVEEKKDKNAEVVERGGKRIVKCIEVEEKGVKVLDNKDHSSDVVVDTDTDMIESKAREVETPKREKASDTSDTDSDTQNTVLFKKSKVADITSSASSGRGGSVSQTSGRIPVRVEDVYTDSEEEEEEENSGELNRNMDKNVSDIPATSETDSVDPEDQKDSMSLPGSSRASSLEPIQTPFHISMKALLERSSPSTLSQKSLQSPGTPTVRATRPRKCLKKSFNLEDCKKAFEQGWKREIVFRATVDPNKSSTKADIYYYAPNGKKLRSRVEIEDYLFRQGIKNLTLDNFTWIKEPLGVCEEYEQIRHASRSMTGSNRGKLGTPNASAGGTPNASAGSTPNASAGGTPTASAGGTPNASVGATPTDVPKTEPFICAQVEMQTPPPPPPKKKRGRPPKISSEKPVKRARMKITPIIPLSLKKGTDSSPGVKGAYPHTPVSVKPINVPNTQPKCTSPIPPSTTLGTPVNKSWKPVITLASPTNVGSSTTQRPIQPAPAKTEEASNKFSKSHIVYTTKICNERKLTSKILTPMLTGEARQRTFHCTGHCPMGGGMVPCLHCVKCLCLFHPECTFMSPITVNLIQAGAAKFLCPNCYREMKETAGASSWVPPKPFEPLAYDPASEDSESEGDKMDREISIENYIHVNLRPESPLTPPTTPPSQGYKGLEEAAAKIFSASQVSKPCDTATTTIQSMQSQSVQQVGSDPANLVSNSAGVMGGIHPNIAGNQLLQLQAPGSNAARFLLVRTGANGEMVPIQGGPHLGMPRGILLPPGIVGGQMPFMIAGSSPQQQHTTTAPFMLNSM